MSDTLVYGVDTSQPITPVMVRDAIVQCFISAHKESLDVDASIDEHTKEEMVIEDVKQAFASTDGDFEEPDKQSLIRAVTALKKFSAPFRNPEIIMEHFKSILSLIEKLED